MAKYKSDFIIYTASDPDACFLVDYLREKGFIVPSDDICEAAMVLVVDTTRQKLLAALKVSGRDITHWRIREVGAYSKGR